MVQIDGQRSHERPSYRRVLRVLRRRGALVVLCALVAGGAAFALSERQAKHYTATTSLLFSDNQLVQQVAGLQPTGTAAQNLQSTWVQVLQLGDMAAKTAQSLGHGLTPASVRS